MIGLLSAVFNISVCVGFPITVFIVLLAKSKKLNTELKIFIVGICTYLAAQILFRQPLLAILQNIDSYRILISTNRVAYVAVLAVTAACAEEVGRYIAFRFFVKNPEQQNTPLYFGLGHGGIEALSVGVNNVILLVCSPYTLINMGADVALAGVERISTLLAQVAFSYIVFCSYRKEKYRYLILAIILHTAYDLPIILLDYGVSPFIFDRGAKPLRRYELLGGISLLSPEYLLSFERCPFHTETPDHYALVSYLIDLLVSQSSALMPLHSKAGYQSAGGHL